MYPVIERIKGVNTPPYRIVATSCTQCGGVVYSNQDHVVITSDTFHDYCLDTYLGMEEEEDEQVYSDSIFEE